MKTIGDLAAALESFAPLSLAESWDNVGLLLGDASRRMKGPVLLTIDLTETVAHEAAAAKAAAVIAYHPPIFSGVKRLTMESVAGRVLLPLIEAGIAVYSPHTALDAARGGVTDWLLGLVADDEGEKASAIQAHRSIAPSQASKLVVFVPTDPPEVIEEVRAAMSAAGAGRIGVYRECSFAVPGVGSFFGEAGANPAVGEAGRLEQVTEIRLEMVCAEGDLAGAIDAMRRVHPYEEPAYDVLKLEPKPIYARLGAGRMVTLKEPQRPSAIAAKLKRALGEDVTVQLAARSDEAVATVGAVPGSGGSVVEGAIRAGCRVFITGEMKHHDILGALDKGCAVILAGHTETERGYLPVLASRLRGLLAGVDFRISEMDASPLRTV